MIYDASCFDRETMEHLLDHQSKRNHQNAIRPCISAIFGLYYANDAFNYYMTVPSGQVLIDIKNCNRCCED
jgi:hypothetical protein